MRVCDCSNCEPDEAEALWLAQPAMTNVNFDCALEMDEVALEELLASLPDPPHFPLGDSRPIPYLCGPDDPILDCPALQNLVSRWIRVFNDFWHSTFPEPCHLGPDDYFGQDLAWDLAKNVDILQDPEDLGVVLASEAISGQFAVLFDEFLEWKNLESSTDIIALAANRRDTPSRGPPKLVQSEARVLQKLRDAQAKAFERAAVLEKKEREKQEAARQRAALKEALSIERAQQRAAAKAQRENDTAAKKELARLEREAVAAAKREHAQLEREANSAAKRGQARLTKEAAATAQNEVAQTSPRSPVVPLPAPRDTTPKRPRDHCYENTPSNKRATQVFPWCDFIKAVKLFAISL
ncbi:uncharacterized protein MELLADRAFT_107684 [Melampsora larici-populina 98AG31]|uniref:Uncharacterized protein n=1 Tax=Melampsora larici-populina (strain 98AG31 / pathotype 3-4-7) TaxID=747676 RepID=F4RQF5_MELLP|nr:uncharacterized protein MELLADRAFT_107684 [Melampsora larici-populina 98AG31]EGG05417.1 hypothetical protein MELLADRAFT_107684 [Melampsora larici-populina 98AG31]